MPFDYSSNPLAQAFISEGQARGYSPTQIAAVLGNSQQENNLNSSGNPGDSGTAFGGMQWRGDRFSNLQDFASGQGTNWTDPNTQAKFYYNELEGPEKQWGSALRSAGTLQDANNAVISSLRPAGWSANNPQNGDAYDTRLSNAQNAYASLGNAGTTTASNSSDTGIGGTGALSNVLAYGDNPADLPAGNPVSSSGGGGSGFATPGSTTASMVPDPTQSLDVDNYDGTHTRQEAADNTNADGTGKDETIPTLKDWDAQAAKGGSDVKMIPGDTAAAAASGGALSTQNSIGGGILDWLKSDKAVNAGNALTRVGAALMARDNPSGAAALLSTLPNPNQALNAQYTQAQINHLKSLDSSDDSKDQTANHIKVNPDGTSTVIHIAKDGTASTKTLGTPTPGYEKPPAPGVQKTFQDNDLQFGNAVNTINLANSVRDRIINKNIPLTFAQGVWNVAKNYTGNADEASALSKDAETLVKQYAGIRAQAEHMRAAVALKQAEDQIAPQGAQYDQRLMLGAMQKMIDYMHNVGQTSLEANNRTVKTYPQWTGDRSRFQPAWDSVEMDNAKYGKQADAWIKNRDTQNAPAAGGAPSFGQWRTKGQPAPQPSPVAPLPSPLPPSPLQPNPTAATVGGSVIPQ